MFEQALNEAQTSDADLLTGEFYFNYGAAAEQAGLIPKAAELFKKTIALDPTGKTLPYPGAAYNYLGFMWVDRDQNIDEGGADQTRAGDGARQRRLYRQPRLVLLQKGAADKALEQLLKAMEATNRRTPRWTTMLPPPTRSSAIFRRRSTTGRKPSRLGPDNKAEIEKKIDAAKVKVTSLPAVTPVLPPAK